MLFDVWRFGQERKKRKCKTKRKTSVWRVLLVDAGYTVVDPLDARNGIFSWMFSVKFLFLNDVEQDGSHEDCRWDRWWWRWPPD